ncbi:MAG: hypothetical protein FWE44_00720 [Defluviitaleaceae bacterium]|nr:hypothetical protein [Defluviitaleaceae bacterium]
MRKILLPALLLVVGLFVLAACGGSNNDDNADSPLVGVWNFEVTPWWTFNADGTGTRPTHHDFNPVGTDSFNWSTSGDTLTVNLTAGPVFDDILYGNVESWAFDISGNTLTLTSNQVEGIRWQYTRGN